MSSADSTQKQFQSRPETFNGAERDRYTWSQTITDLDVRIKVKYVEWRRDEWRRTFSDSAKREERQRREGEDQQRSHSSRFADGNADRFRSAVVGACGRIDLEFSSRRVHSGRRETQSKKDVHSFRTGFAGESRRTLVGKFSRRRGKNQPERNSSGETDGEFESRGTDEDLPDDVRPTAEGGRSADVRRTSHSSSRRFSSTPNVFSFRNKRRCCAKRGTSTVRRFRANRSTRRCFLRCENPEKVPFAQILPFRFQMDEKRKAFRRSTTGVKAERRKKKEKNDEGNDEARRRNPKAFSIQNPVKAQQEFRR